MKKILLILMWSVISAAFIGPGTVTTAASAGTQTGFKLLWTLLFSIIACFVLQEASARVTIASGLSLGAAIRRRFRSGIKGVFVLLLVVGAVVLGCAAYEAGNILGSVAGASLQISIAPWILTFSIGIFAFLLLFTGSVKTVARILGFIVAVMGCLFFATACMYKFSVQEVIRGIFIPSFPEDSTLLILGLVGTTVVPYNLFLGSSIAEGQKKQEMRLGLGIAMFIGGMISMAVLIVGTAVSGTFSYEHLSTVLEKNLGIWAKMCFALGLFAAGFSSAVTAPLAAAITARSLFEKKKGKEWSEKSWRYRSVWIFILSIGIIFGILGVKPVPAIILAQALNGLLLPFIAVFIYLVINDVQLMGKMHMNGIIGNIIMGIVIIITVLLGITHVSKAVSSTFNLAFITKHGILILSGIVTLSVFSLVFLKHHL